jgi:hypothetical protein
MTMGPIRTSLSVAAVSLVVLLSASSTPAQEKVNLTGTWIFDVQTTGGSGTPTVVLKQDGEKLTGSYDGQLGKTTLAGSVTGQSMQFNFMGEVQGQRVEVVYQGTIESATAMKGTVDIGGGAATGSFTAKKK